MLQLVLGRTGTGKTEYVFSSVKKLIESGEDNILLITPEQFSFISERRLLTDLGEANVGKVENTSFTRLAGEITKVYVGDSLPVLSKGAKAVMMKRAIEAVQDSLLLFHKNITSASFINSAVKIYDEMKSCRVSCDDIIEAGRHTDREILSRKLNDIALIIGAYDALISNCYYDSANELTRLYEKLLDMDYFKDRYVFIDGFSGFVAQEYKVLEVILKQAKAVYITLCTDSVNNPDSYDLFSYVNSNIAILREVTDKIGVTVNQPIYLNQPYRFQNDALKLLECNLFLNVKNTTDEVPENIHLYAAKNLTDECDTVSRNIVELLKKGVRASDITVICRDLEKYQRELSFSFRKFNIPYYNDERQSISAQPLIMLVNFLLRVLIYSYRSEDIFSLLKTGMTALNDETISALENYVYLWSINGSKWKQEFTQSTKGYTETINEDDRENIEAVNAARKYVIDIISKFAKRVKKGTVTDFCKALYYAILDFSADEKLRALAVSLDADGKSALAKEQGRIWDLLMDILNKLTQTDDGRPVSCKEFYQLFHLMIDSEDLGVVPMGLDNVQLGSADRIRTDNPKAVFIVGANEGEFPQNVVSAGLLSESDRAALIQNQFKLYSYGETLNAQERYFAYIAMCCASDYLFVSYRASGENAHESAIVNEIRSVFPNIVTEVPTDTVTLASLVSDSNAFEILASHYPADSTLLSSLKHYFEENSDYQARLSSVKRLYQTEETVIANPQLARELFHQNMYLSASRIEDYYNCAFRYFCKFGLGAKPRKKAQMDPMQTGTVIHYVLERLISENDITALDVTNLSILINQYLTEYLETKMGDAQQFTPRFKYQFMRLSKMLISVAERLTEEFSQSDFVPKAFELEIGDGNKGEAVQSQRLLLPDGGSIQISGAIDRVDVFERNGTQYVRVVDYKSGGKEFRLSDILYGLNLQMFIYLFTLCNSDNPLAGVASGVLYMHSARSVFSMSRNSDSQAIKKEENKGYKMKGVVLNDEEHEIAKHMERDLGGKYIPVTLEKDKITLKGNIVTMEEIGILANKINALITDMGVSLHSGSIPRNPINGKNHDKTCEFCDYRAVCMNVKEITNREMQELDNAQVIDKMKEEQHA